MGGISKFVAIGGVVGLIGVAILFPLYYNPSPTLKGVKKVKGKVPEVEFFDGSFKLYDALGVAKEGKYGILQKFRHWYLGRVLFVKDLRQGYFATASKGVLRGEKLFLTKFKIWNSDYTLLSPSGVYNLKKKYLEGKKFTFHSPDARGTGNWFRVWNDKRIEAKKVHYFLKEEPNPKGKSGGQKG
jgi:hypothetical protein